MSINTNGVVNDDDDLNVKSSHNKNQTINSSSLEMSPVYPSSSSSTADLEIAGLGMTIGATSSTALGPKQQKQHQHHQQEKKDEKATASKLHLPLYQMDRPIDLTTGINYQTLLTNDTEESRSRTSQPVIPNLYRNRIGFWLLGLCNNFVYVVMLSAAVHLIERSNPDDDDKPDDPTKICTLVSTGTILLADIIPSLIIKMTVPFLNIPIDIRVAIAISLTILSFLLTSFSTGMTMTFIGVISASASSGLGEISFFAFSARFEKNVIAFWSSGTGMAGLAGAGLYSLITKVVSVETCLLIMLVVPVIEASVYWILIVRPRVNVTKNRSTSTSNDSLDANDETNLIPTLTFMEKIKLVRPLVFRFMVPLGLVYFFEYFINQGLDQLMYFNNISIPRSEQYSWYQTMYQVGVFISRSSVQLFQINKLWLLAGLQGGNVVIFLCHILWPYLGSFYVVLTIILFEGLLGGASYVNTFYKVRLESPPSSREFNLSFVAFSDSFGIVLAGLSAIPAHNWLCEWMSTHR